MQHRIRVYPNATPHNAAGIKVGDIVKVDASKVNKAKGGSAGDQVFVVEKLGKDYGPCPASVSDFPKPDAIINAAMKFRYRPGHLSIMESCPALYKSNSTNIWLDPESRCFCDFQRSSKPVSINEYEVKRSEVLIISIIGGLMVDLLLFSVYAINPAEIWRAVVIRLGIFTPCAALSTVINYCSPRLWVRETS